jgi:hypothetical protein
MALAVAGCTGVVRLWRDIAIRDGALGSSLQGGRNEVAEQRRRALGARLELGMELGGDKEGVIVELDDLY